MLTPTSHLEIMSRARTPEELAGHEAAPASVAGLAEPVYSKALNDFRRAPQAALHTAIRLVLAATPDQLPLALDALRDMMPNVANNRRP